MCSYNHVHVLNHVFEVFLSTSPLLPSALFLTVNAGMQPQLLPVAPFRY